MPAGEPPKGVVASLFCLNYLSAVGAPYPSGAWQKYPYNQTYGIIRAKNG